MFADDRLVIGKIDRRGVPTGSTSEIALSTEQAVELAGLAVDGGLMEWHLNQVEISIDSPTSRPNASAEVQALAEIVRELRHYQREARRRAAREG